MWSNRNSHSLLVEMKAKWYISEDWQFLTKLNILTIRSSNRVPWYLLKEVENLCPHKTCTQIFIAAVFIAAKKWKEPKFPLTEEWINKMWYTHIMESYCSIKRNGDFPGGAVVKNPPANAGDTGSSPGLGRSHMPWGN